ncbi:deoxyadenosine/deoxycytidine kinase [Pontibacter ummariensis]|uniref:Deoxyadenosine/deoxycytidine kinase n=1 Tax=Pontibacter ummariensis TaxID=1610492 RepID=A0A239BFS8_9BACT|nr:deoxynucleoside kinase [Pontibacter ummariensis]PRY16510.1 deoxyadenosine/deoxycytidine kinase [Pontibacter ummariensis]SNS06452.1 Deoxyadenosine/deoxycytidine kinase [Pontibacter ummariensis]
MHIAIVGNIGAGKTTLATKLSQHFKWDLYLEAVENNPYLKDFYEDMERWAFHLQVFFLNSRFNQVQQIQSSSRSVIQDRTIYEDAHIFAKNLHQSNLMSTRDYENYLALFQSMISMVKAPDLMIYLKADLPKLIGQIEKRNRDYESSISINYLRNLNEHYNTWMSTYNQGKLLTIDVNSLDFVANPEDLGTIIEKIQGELFGLF